VKITVRHGAILAILMLAAACSGPTSPTTTQTPVVPSPPGRPSTNFPPLSGSSRTFVFDHELSSYIDTYTPKSQFVLYDDGGFVLQFLSIGANYRGGYTEANGVVTFAWEGWSVAGPWGATGALTGNSLIVHYNDIMQFTDFVDAAYVLAP